MFQTYPSQLMVVMLQRQLLMEIFGWFYRRVSEEMKENIAQIRLEEMNTKVNQGEDLTCWEQALEIRL